MNSPFAAALAQMDIDLDAQMGERVRVIPIKSGDFGKSVDTARAEYEITALVTETDPSADKIPSLDARMNYEQFDAEIIWDLLPPGARLRKNDEMVLLERPYAPRLQINRTERVDRGRVIVILGPIAG